jgi:hypothetical protein
MKWTGGWTSVCDAMDGLVVGLVDEYMLLLLTLILPCSFTIEENAILPFSSSLIGNPYHVFLLNPFF